MREEIIELRHRLQVGGPGSEGDNEVKREKERLERRIQGLVAEVERLKKEKDDLETAKLEVEKRNTELKNKMDASKHMYGEKPTDLTR